MLKKIDKISGRNNPFRQNESRNKWRTKIIIANKTKTKFHLCTKGFTNKMTINKYIKKKKVQLYKKKFM